MKKIDAKEKKVGEKIPDLKKETVAKEPVHKGYNEKNPTQPQGAFKPDSAKK